VETLAAEGITFSPRQTSLSRSTRRATLRGLHFQTGASAETKIVTCLSGSVLDVALDLRPDSPTFRHHHFVELTGANGFGLLIPPGCAHGLLTLTDDAAVLYQIDRDYDPARASGVRWNDPAFSIAWPMVPSLISTRDQSWPDFVA
jgi:dTDP-4-dehydrorhamnose 3,5-epimerase